MRTDLRIVAIRDNIVIVEGFNKYQNHEIVEFENQDTGIVLRADEKKAHIALIDLNMNDPVKIGQTVKPLGREFSVKVYDNILGSIIDVHGNFLVNSSSDRAANLLGTRTAFVTASPIYTRDFVNQPLHTGTLAIDGVIPIGLGQKELIIGDRQTGKTAIVLNMIYSQRHQNTKVIYVAIGKKRAEIVFDLQKLRQKGVLDKTIIVAADADTTSVSKYLAPYSGMAIAEYFQQKGEDVIIIFDDLTSHADAYREISLLTGAAPGRDAYPGDIFYQHSRLLERAGRYIDEVGGGSITAIPIIETQAGDISGYIPTNVISITDGQIFTSKTIFNSGIKPAIDIPYSVSRISSAVQTEAMKKVASGLKLLISQYHEFQKVATFSSSMAEENIAILRKGKIVQELFKQDNEELVPYHAGVLMLALVKEGYLDFYADDKITDLSIVKRVIVNFLENDVLGRKLTLALESASLKNINLINLYITHLILPILKFHLVSSYEIIKTSKSFQTKYADVRNDGRIIWQKMKSGAKEGIVYDYDLF